MTPEQQIREALNRVRATCASEDDGSHPIEAQLHRLATEALLALDRLESEHGEARHEADGSAFLKDCAETALRAAEGREAALREALAFVIEAAEEVLELEEPPVEVADVATSAARAITDRARAALAGVPADEPAETK